MLSLGLALYAAGAFLQIAEEWRQRGPTDTSYVSLAALVAGPGLVALAVVGTQHWGLVLVTALPSALAAWLLAWKLRDALRSRWWRI
jgi:hypothetical protein